MEWDVVFYLAELAGVFGLGAVIGGGLKMWLQRRKKAGEDGEQPIPPTETAGGPGPLRPVPTSVTAIEEALGQEGEGTTSSVLSDAEQVPAETVEEPVAETVDEGRHARQDG